MEYTLVAAFPAGARCTGDLSERATFWFRAKRIWMGWPQPKTLRRNRGRPKAFVSNNAHPGLGIT
jgi:hypothetical protein